MWSSGRARCSCTDRSPRWSPSGRPPCGAACQTAARWWWTAERSDRRSAVEDRKRIDVSQEHELRDWSKKFRVSADRLKEAVQAVGTEADKVKQHLSSGSDRKPAKRAGERAG